MSPKENRQTKNKMENSGDYLSAKSQRNDADPVSLRNASVESQNTINAFEDQYRWDEFEKRAFISSNKRSSSQEFKQNERKLKK
jgi:hypothetical protein